MTTLSPAVLTLPRIEISAQVESATRPDGLSWTQPIVTFKEPVPGAKVYATRPDGAVLMVRMWRHVLNDFNWEIPGGSGDLGDASVVETATRELVEETGHVPVAPGRLLATVHADVGCMRKSHAVVRFDLPQDSTAGQRDDEAMDVRWFTREEIALMIAEGQVVCALTLSALALGVFDDLTPR